MTLPASITLPTGSSTFLNGNWVIESISAQYVPGIPHGSATPWLSGPLGYGHFRYTCKCVNINQIGSWLDFWAQLGGGGSAGGAGAGLVATSGGAGNASPSQAGLASPLTTKGDLWGFDTVNDRVPVGSNGTVLTADSTQALGLKWAAATTYVPLNQSVKVNGVEYSDGYQIDVNRPAPVTVNGSVSYPRPSPVVAASDITAQTTAQTLATYTPAAASGTFRCGGYVRITAIATDVLQLQIGWTDETSTAQTLSLVPAGAATANLAATGTYQFSPVDVRGKIGIAVTVKVILSTGGGSVAYDAGGSIMQLT
jgi:hypothetical protein